VDIAAEAPQLMQDVIGTFERGLDVFETKDWAGAARIFEEVLKLRPDDGPTLKYLDRALKFQKEPPAANWDGVFSMTEK
jgi:adenylate cyclase